MTEAFSSRPVTLRDYLLILRRRKWIVLQAIVLVPVVAVIFSKGQEAKYKASAEVYLERQSLAATASGQQDPTLTQDPDRLGRTEAKLAQDPRLARRVLRATHATNLTPGAFLGSSDVSPEPNTDLLLKFSVTNHDRALAERLARAYAAQYVIYRPERAIRTLENARLKINDEIRKLRASGAGEQSPALATLLESRQRLQELEVFQGSNVRVVPSTGEATQVAPQTKRNAILGVVLGLVLGLALAFLWEAIDRTVRSEEEIQSTLGLPLLARSPKLPRRSGDSALAMVDNPSSVHAEAYRRLRTNLEFTNLERHAKTIIVTSGGQQEGKTTTAANLAVAFARAGRRVVLVDLDLRSPSVERAFRMRGRHGVTHVALGHISLEDALVKIPVEPAVELVSGLNGGGSDGLGSGSLEVLPAGLIPPEPGEFVSSKAVERILEELRDRADIVLIDSPPLLAVGDTVALSARVDALIAVVRLNTTRRETLRELRRTLDSCPCDVLGYVITGANVEEAYGYVSYAPATPSRRSRERTRR
jgi:tyrosine-protein kinase